MHNVSPIRLLDNDDDFPPLCASGRGRAFHQTFQSNIRGLRYSFSLAQYAYLGIHFGSSVQIQLQVLCRQLLRLLPAGPALFSVLESLCHTVRCSLPIFPRRPIGNLPLEC